MGTLLHVHRCKVLPNEPAHVEEGAGIYAASGASRPSADSDASGLAERAVTALGESQRDKEKFVRAMTMRLQQQQLLIRAKPDRAYDDRLSGRVSDELWTKKSAELENELQRVRSGTARHERASHDYESTGVQILDVLILFTLRGIRTTRRYWHTLPSNCTFDRGSLTATYVKPFDLFAAGAKNGDGSSGWTRSRSRRAERGAA